MNEFEDLNYIMGKILKVKQKKVKQSNRLVKRINDFLLNYFNWVILIIVLTILVTGFSIIIEPKYELVIRDVEIVRRDKEGEYLIQQAYFNKLNELKDAYQSIKPEDKRKIDIILPEQVEIEEFFSSMEALVLKNGLILASLNINSGELELKENKITNENENKEDTSSSSSARDQRKFYKTEEAKAEINDLSEKIGKIHITMSIIGTDYDGLKNLLQAIENNLRLMDMENISWSPDGNSTNLQLVTYYIK